MSTTVLHPVPTATAPPARDGGGMAAVLALARFEARELFLQIAVFAALLLYVGYTLWHVFFDDDGMDAYPVLQDVDRSTQVAPLLVAVAVLVCVNRAALRSHRHGTDAHFDVLPLLPWQRTLAHALSAVPAALVVALVVTVEFTRAALRPGAVGHGSVAELAVGPLMVLLAGAAGVLLARAVRSSFTAPLVVIGLYVLSPLAMAGVGDAHWLRWLGLAVPETGGDPLPSDLLGRPAAWHALYLAGLAVLLLGGALLLSGARTRAVVAMTAAAVVATGTGIAGQSPGDSAALIAARTKASGAPEKLQTCVEHGTSTYCAFPEWTGRTADWAEVAGRVQSLAGGAAAQQKLTVRQRVEARFGLETDSVLTPSGTSGEVTVGTQWGGNRVPEFAVGTAAVLVAGSEKSAGEVCDARIVTIMWLALGADPQPLTSLRNVRLGDTLAGSDTVLAPAEPLSMSTQQTRIVRELLSRPRDGVTAKVKAHWAELTSPKTSLARVAELLDVKAPAKGDDACAG